ncbi:Uncharacterized protein SCF082_LOCUS27311 [Durusdinium trenchii]|uniref:Uncharacterized protein n=1 Tax=Durusdinium trenchii TaxID=1381693 RepID=A0ABP0MGI7_9DINO
MLGMLDELLGGPGVGESAHVQYPPPNWLRAEPEPASRPSLRGSISSVESGRRGEQRRKRPEPSPRAHATGEGCGEGGVSSTPHPISQVIAAPVKRSERMAQVQMQVASRDGESYQSVTRTVTFQDMEPVESETTDQEMQTPQEPVRSHRTSSMFGQRISRTFLSGRSLWRYPSTPGQMPRYLQRKFRMKTFALMGFQLALVLAITVLVDYLQLWGAMMPTLGQTPAQVVFYVIGAINFTSILALQNFKDRYPLNYLLLCVTTVLSGIFWGLTRGVTNVTIHFQILAILSFTMAGASIASGILTNLERKIAGPHLLLASILPCWFVGCLIDALLTFLLFKLDPLEVSGAIGFSFLLICILLVDVGKLLDRCRPDDFMAVLVAMNSTLMVVVSIPFFVLTFCFLHSGEAMDRATTEPSVNAESVVPPINEMTAVV